MRYYIDPIKKYAVTKGRASRKELWLFILFDALFGFIFGFIDGFNGWYLFGVSDWGLLSSIYILATMCPRICLCVRRLHDIGKTGAYYLCLIVPLYNIYALIQIYFWAGDPCENQYGPPPFASEVQPEPEQTALPPAPKPVEQAPIVFAQPTLKQVEAPQMRFCRKCGAKLMDGGLFCGMCGADVSSMAQAPTVHFCRKCGTKLTEGYKFCIKCGSEVWKENKS